jgi:hypothetical protein
MRFILARAALVLVVILWCTTPGIAQAARPGSLRIVVRDATGLPISGAEVVIAAAAGNGASAEARTADNGTADVTGLAPGVYRLTISAPGFEAATLTDLNVRANGRLRRDVTLKIAAFVEDIEVQPAVEDRTLAEAFTTQLSDDQLAALPDDPDELAEVLAQLAGSDAEIRVDGFADDTLPPGTQIESVVIRYDVSASTSGGGPRVEVRTRPGGDRWRANMSGRVRDEALNARNAFADQRPSGQTQQYNWTVNGPLVRNRTGVSLSLERATTTDQQAVRAGLPDGSLFSALLPRPSERLGINARLEHAISPTQRLRVDVRQSNEDASNQGIGEFDLPERAFARTRRNGTLRAGHSATLRGQITNDLRIVTAWQSSEAAPSSTAAAIVVPGSLSFGGAQTQGGRVSRTLEVENEVRLTVRQSHHFISADT